MKAAYYRYIMLLLLCLTAGIVDVIGYLSIGHVFTANMTGNIVLLGLALGNSLQKTAMYSLIALLGFIIGVIIASLIAGKQEKSFWPSSVTTALIVEGGVLLLFACLSSLQTSAYILIILLSIAMGLQTTAARKLGVAGISTTVLTGTLANFFEDISGRFFNKKKQNILHTDALLRALTIVLYCLGAVIAAVAEPAYSFAVVWIPIVIILWIVITAGIKFRGV
ncbi:MULTISPECIES: YoaK family protein [Bacillus]|uniref:YoaK family protein n=1 Tax=Bacillus TaxID=1386 RepID=UPI0020C19F27|nr:YoaK family protein [Bacillus glycinifermentans]